MAGPNTFFRPGEAEAFLQELDEVAEEIRRRYSPTRAEKATRDALTKKVLALRPTLVFLCTAGFSVKCTREAPEDLVLDPVRWKWSYNPFPPETIHTHQGARIGESCVQDWHRDVEESVIGVFDTNDPNFLQKVIDATTNFARLKR